MLKNNMFVLICCLCVKTKPLNAKMLPEQETVSLKASEEDSVKSFQQEATTALYFTTEDPVKSQNIFLQAAEEKTTNVSLKSSAASVQVSSGRSGLFRIPLSLSLDSVDDMYYGCSEKMLIKVKRQFLPRSGREDLHTAYTTLCAIRAMKTKDTYDLLSLDHFRALCAYTAGAYDNLNRAVRKSKASYKTSFEFHALHFLLSDAIRLLKLNQRNCYTTYRRSKLLFSGEPGQTIRFGSFASSSLNPDLLQFGQRTCFEIRTCFGAYLKFYSELDSDEDEVLIPPYEMFNIVSVDTTRENHLNCDVFYKLENAGVYSSLNCQAVDL